ncbi:MAG: rod shape-determining protein RodA [Gammaproteobacteria bacterium]|nr:rod shape-determining protein RodA [Gammaproteobacteria bacterium]
MARDFHYTLPAGTALAQRRLYNVHLDLTLLVALIAIAGFGLLVLNAVSEQAGVVTGQMVRVGLAFVVMVALAQLEPRTYLRWAPIVYLIGLALLVLVLVLGVTAKGSTRWLDLPGLPRFQPSEMMKLAVPLAVAWYLHERSVPPRGRHLLVAVGLCIAPAALIAPQPDLGTSLLVAGGGLTVIVLAGIRWWLVAAAGGAMAAAAPVLWLFLNDYQRKRILTFLNPEQDPLGAGWNIAQSKIAIGSGGLFGKGLGEGTQSQLDFLPESGTDFIIAVVGEELGLVGAMLLLALYLVVIARALFMATSSPTTFGRLVAGALTLVFFAYVFVNIAMVSGLLPVVGVPLPLVSYGGTSAITLLAGFGIVMSIHSHRGW